MNRSIKSAPYLLEAADYIVIGFYTPNYEELAETFSLNLTEHGQPHILYGIAPVGRWSRATLLKPRIVLRAMVEFPGKTLILMDVDCTVHGDLAQVADPDNPIVDVSLHIRAWQERGLFSRAYPYAGANSRMIVFRPTQKAWQAAKEWDALCSNSRNKRGEPCLTVALTRVPGLTLEIIESVAHPNERTIMRHPLVTHDSAHTNIIGRRSKPISAALKQLRRGAFRLFGSDYERWKYGDSRYKVGVSK